MSQGGVMGVLKKNPNKWFSLSEISEITGTEKSPLSFSFKKLRKYNEVLWKVGGKTKQGYLYKYKD
jgi:predicted transcriptional regulator